MTQSRVAQQELRNAGFNENEASDDQHDPPESQMLTFRPW